MQKGCPKCGRMIEQNEKSCPYCGYNFDELNSFFNQKKETNYVLNEKYAGFIKRLVAGLFDQIIIFLFYLPIIFLIKQKTVQNIILMVLLYIIMYILYHSICERTSWRGSIGKKILEIEVTDENENPETFPIALKRNIYKILNVLTLGIGFLITAVSKEKQALNDKLAHTYVINKLIMKTEDNLSYASPFKRLLSFFIDGLVIYVLCYIVNFIFTQVSNMKDIQIQFNNILNSANYIIRLTLVFFYFPFAESTKGATIGKRICHLKITNLNGEKMNFIKSFVRQYFLIIDYICLGFLLTFVTEKRQTLNDKIMKTVVINR